MFSTQKNESHLLKFCRFIFEICQVCGVHFTDEINWHDGKQLYLRNQILLVSGIEFHFSFLCASPLIYLLGYFILTANF